jgi:hypothetical protein
MDKEKIYSETTTTKEIIIDNLEHLPHFENTLTPLHL